MKLIISILVLLFSVIVFIDFKKPRTISSTSSFTVSGRVPAIMKVNIIKQTKLSYQINEVSNNPEGYILSLKTDAKIVYYDNQKLTVQNGEVILNQVSSQTESINSFKTLKFEDVPSSVEVSITAP